MYFISSFVIDEQAIALVIAFTSSFSLSLSGKAYMSSE